MPKETNNNKKQNKEKKHFVKDFKAELKRVIWPTTKQLANNTIAVITIVLITAVIVFALDFTFEKINTYGIEKIKSVVGVEENAEENHDHDNSEENTEENHDHDNSEENTVEVNETANTVVESNETNTEASNNDTTN